MSLKLDQDDRGLVLQTPSKSSSPIRFTSTGKISHAKTRVYTQRYRKEWELLPDFQGWLTSIPYHPTRAYCLYCKKDLHAHRLSLLKHMCTMKHQRSALAKHCNGNLKPNVQYIETNQEQKEQYLQEEYLEDTDIQYFVEKLDMNEEGGVEYETRYEEAFEEVEDEPSNVEYITADDQKVMDGSTRDALEVAMAHVHSEDLTQDEEQIEMVVESTESQDIIICENSNEEEKQKQSDINKFTNENNQSFKQKQSQTARKSMKRVVFNPSSTITMTPAGKAITVQGNKFMVKNVKNNVQTLVVSDNADEVIPETIRLCEENDKTGDVVSETENSKRIKREIAATNAGSSHRKSRISTHVIDTNKGLPIGGLQVSIYKLVDGRWTFLNESSTMANGYCNDLIDPEKSVLTCGRYKLHFDVDKYFTQRDIETIYPFIEIVFDVKNPTAQYHMPILLSPYGYTTYRGYEF